LQFSQRDGALRDQKGHFPVQEFAL